MIENWMQCGISMRPYGTQGQVGDAVPGLRCAPPWAILTPSLREGNGSPDLMRGMRSTGRALSMFQGSGAGQDRFRLRKSSVLLKLGALWICRYGAAYCSLVKRLLEEASSWAITSSRAV